MAQLDTKSPVRVDSQTVIDNADHVRINEAVIPEFCEYITSEYDFTTADWDAPVFPNYEDYSIEQIVDFFIVGNAINYCFNNLETGDKFAYEYLGTEWSGAFGMWAGLMNEFRDRQQILESEYLRNLRTEDVSNIFKPSNGVEIPLLESRVENLNSVGTLMKSVGGTFWNLFEGGETTLYGENGVVTTLANNESYEDTRMYDDSRVRFDKRSQLAISMLYGKLQSTEHAFKISDMDEFTVFADYGIPAGLATHNVIEYSDELETRIQAQEVIPENSPEEVEIRAATVIAGEKIKQYLQSNFEVETKIPVLDYVLWCMRSEADTSVHLTKTTAY